MLQCCYICYRIIWIHAFEHHKQTKRNWVSLTDPVAERESQSKLSGPFLLAPALVIHLQCNKMHSYYFMKEEPNMKTRRRSSVLNNSIILYKQLYNVLTLTRHFDRPIKNKSCVYFNYFCFWTRLWCTQCTLEDRELKLAHFWKTKAGFCLWLPQTTISPSQAWLQSRFGNYIRLHGVWWEVTGGLKLLFHLTLCNKVNIFLLSTDESNSNPTIEMSSQDVLSRKQLPVILITIHHMISITDTRDIFGERSRHKKQAVTCDHRKQTEPPETSAQQCW